MLGISVRAVQKYLLILSLSAHTGLSRTRDSLVFYRNKNLFSAGAPARLRLTLRSIQMIQLNSVARAVAQGGRL